MAAIKDDLRHGRSSIVELLADPSACLPTASLVEILLAVPGPGKVRTRRLLTGSSHLVVQEDRWLRERRRRELLRALGG